MSRQESEDKRVPDVESLEADLTRMRNLEADLREREYRLKAHLENTPIGAISWDLDFLIDGWNPAAESIFGYSKAEVMGKHPVETILPSEIRAAVDEVFQEIVDEKGGFYNRNENLTKDGRRIICEWYNTPLKNHADEVIGVASLVHDISDRIRFENALRKSEAEYRSTLEDLLVGVVVHAADTSIMLSNPESRRILGLTTDQMLGRKAIDPAWRFVREDLSALPLEEYPVNRVISSGQPIKDILIGVKLPVRDHITWAIVNAIPVFEDNGDLIKVIVNFVDVTQRKRAEAERTHLEAQLLQSQKMESLGTLAGGIAHDFNNLLTPILGYTELAKQSMSGGSEERVFLQNVEDAANRAKELVKKILMVSRSSVAKAEMVQLAEVVDEVIAVVQASISPSIEIRKEVVDELPCVAADPSQIYQVVLNLCTNAVQAMAAEKKGSLNVRLSAVTDGPKTADEGADQVACVCLQVRDSGCGMDATIQERIFEPFFTTREKSEDRGTGLGLSMTASIVKRHGGRIDVESEVGEGTTFTVFWPVMDDAHQQFDDTTASPPAARQDCEHVLLVDDEQMVSQVGTSILRRLGFTVSSFTDSREALAAFRENPEAFHIVLTDYSMPNLDGPTLIQEMRKIRTDLPILLVTGYPNLATPEKMAAWGCDGVIAKPYGLQRMQEAVREVLDRS